MMIGKHNPQKISVIISLVFFLVSVRSTAQPTELTGTVTAAQGDNVTVKVESAGTLQPAVGDILYIMERANEEGHALGVPGDWVITEVKGDIVKAKGKNLVAGHRPQVNMQAFIQISPGPVHAGEAPKALSEKMPSPTAIGKVIMTRGNHVTIQLSEGQPAVSKGDGVELSYLVDDMKISVGKWRISVINENGTLEAELVETEAQPTIGMDARVFTDPSRNEKRVDSKKKPDQPVASKIEDGNRSSLETACLNGKANACNELGVTYATGKGVALNLSLAVEFYRKACDGGLAMGCSNLGEKYEKGKGVSKDNKLAADYYQKGCEGGNAVGCTNLGYMYEKGKGVSKDDKLAANYYQMGCDGGSGRGCTNLGYMYEFGYGVNKDKQTAVEYYRMGCDKGYARGCTNLGYMYEKGKGVSKDDKLAANYNQRGCDGGNGRGCGNLGWAVYHGRGTSADQGRGIELLQKACKMGHGWSCDKLKTLGK